MSLYLVLTKIFRRFRRRKPPSVPEFLLFIAVLRNSFTENIRKNFRKSLYPDFSFCCTFKTYFFRKFAKFFVSGAFGAAKSTFLVPKMFEKKFRPFRPHRKSGKKYPASETPNACHLGAKRSKSKPTLGFGTI